MKTAYFATALGCALGVLGGCTLVRPLGADGEDHARFANAATPGIPLEVVPMRVAVQTAPACAAAGESSCLELMQIVHAAYLVEHPKATFLVEAALSWRTYEDLRRFSCADQMLLDYDEEQSLGEALRAAGSPRIDFVLVTHAHWDHTGGLLDLERPRVVLGPGEAEFVRAFPKASPPIVMPHHFLGARLETFRWDGPRYENFPRSHDWFGDGSVVLVPTPGHTPGSFAVFLNTVRGRRIVFVGDSAWSVAAVELPSHKLEPMSQLTDADPNLASETLWRLHHLHARYPSLLVVPTHDGAAYDAVSALVR